jgi:hypothetical protein
VKWKNGPAPENDVRPRPSARSRAFDLDSVATARGVIRAVWLKEVRTGGGRSKAIPVEMNSATGTMAQGFLSIYIFKPQ